MGRVRNNVDDARLARALRWWRCTWIVTLAKLRIGEGVDDAPL